MGILRIEGKIKLNQFWPGGKSDADTTKILLNVQADSFSFKPEGANDFLPTNAFVDALAKGEGQRPSPVIKKKTGTITIRLQGIDAPELHYRIYTRYPKCTQAQANKIKKLNKEYRQYLGETATVALSDFLQKSATNGQVECVFESSNIDKPSDAIDCYGRFIGDILVDGGRTNVNRWLLEEGWVFPSFYDSLQLPEIDAYLNAWEKGKTQKERVSEYYSSQVKTFNYNLLYRNKGIPDPKKDKGKVIMPKLFRRFCVYSICSKAGLCEGDFKSFKVYLTSKKDKAILRNDFPNYLASDKPDSMLTPLSQYFSAGKFSESPDEVIFVEKGSVLVNQSGNEIKSW